MLDIRSCLGLTDKTLARKRQLCRPEVFRIPFEPTWTAQKDATTGELKNPYGCHDITAAPGRVYCAAIHGTAIFDVKGLTRGDGSIKGTPLPCEVVPGTRTAAMVTDCDLGGGNDSAATDQKVYRQLGSPQANGWRFLGSVNHPGTDVGNTNTKVRADEGVAVSHEADPTPDGKFMFVTDERGGGVVPPGATCEPGLDNPIGNGGMHVFDISDPSRPRYAQDTEGNKAVFISSDVVPAPTFCNIHVIEQVPGENRVVMAWYSQGIKVVDYFVDGKGRWRFEEVASYRLPGANTWTAEHFKIVDNPDGRRTYYLMTGDIDRGIDIVSWTGKPNPRAKTSAATAAAGSTPVHTADGALLALGLVVLPAAAAVGRRRRR